MTWTPKRLVLTGLALIPGAVVLGLLLSVVAGYGIGNLLILIVWAVAGFMMLGGFIAWVVKIGVRSAQEERTPTTD